MLDTPVAGVPTDHESFLFVVEIPQANIMGLSTIIVPLISSAPLLLYFLLPILLRGIGYLAGTYLRKKTEGRRLHLLELVESSQKIAKDKDGEKDDISRRDSSGSWETVDAQSLRATDNRDRPLLSHKDWSGVVGFFHPFWYALTSTRACVNREEVSRANFCLVATLVEVVKESSGPPFVLPNGIGLKRSASSTQGTVT